MKICQCLHRHIEIMCPRFHIKALFTFRDVRTWDLWKVCLQTFRNNKKICLNLAYFLKNLQTSRENNSRILRFNANFQGIVFYENKHLERFSNLHYCTFRKMTKIKNYRPVSPLDRLKCLYEKLYIVWIFFSLNSCTDRENDIALIRS